jgi:hypothetical protein
MSKLMENKQQMIHIASEIIVLIGLTFYFNQKNKKLLGHIEDLAQRIEEQEDILQKHEQMLQKLLGSTPRNSKPIFIPSKFSKSRKTEVNSLPQNNEIPDKVPLVSSEVSEDESDLDDAIAEELEELEELKSEKNSTNRFLFKPSKN